MHGGNFISLCHLGDRLHRCPLNCQAVSCVLSWVLLGMGLRAEELCLWSCSSSTSPFWWNSKIFEPLFWSSQWSNWVSSVKFSWSYLLILHVTQLWQSYMMGCWSLGCEWGLGIVFPSYKDDWQWFASWRASHSVSSVALKSPPLPFFSLGEKKRFRSGKFLFLPRFYRLKQLTDEIC